VRSATPQPHKGIPRLASEVSAQTCAAAYRFTFQGQEKDNEIHDVDGSMLAFEYRMHDARVGRFLSIDPLAAKYPWNAPYAFAENKVIQFIELEGLEAATNKLSFRPTPHPNFERGQRALDHAKKANAAAPGIVTTDLGVGANAGLGVRANTGGLNFAAGVTIAGVTATNHQEGWISGTPEPVSADINQVILGYGIELQVPDAVSVKMRGAALQAGVTYDGDGLKGKGRETWTFGTEMELGGDVGGVEVSTNPADPMNGKMGLEVTVGPFKGEASLNVKKLGTFIDETIQAIDAILPLPRYRTEPPTKK
jgi:RHS repeat-associated protein